MSAPAMDRALERDIEWDCQRVMLRFYDAFDRGDYAGMVAMFAAGGVWHRAGKALAKDQIAAELDRRPPQQRVRHVLTNILVEAKDPDHAALTCYLTAYRNPDVHRPPEQQRLRAPYLFLHVSASLVRQAGSWCLTEQVMRREFEFVDD
jgi:hypothetical protein